MHHLIHVVELDHRPIFVEADDLAATQTPQQTGTN